VFSTGGSMHSIQSIADTYTDVDCLWQHVRILSEWYGTVDTKLFTTGGNMHNIQPLADTQLYHRWEHAQYPANSRYIVRLKVLTACVSMYIMQIAAKQVCYSM
jgi:hypothetical protein